MTKPGRWSVTEAKAELSRVVRESRRRLQTLERRGEPVALVLAADGNVHVARRSAATGER